MASVEEIEKLLYTALNALRGDLRETDFINAKESIDAGEPGLGLDTICSQLHEFRIRIPNSTFALLSRAGKLMNMPAKTWEKLLPLIDEDSAK